MHDQTKPSSQNLNGFAIKRVVKWNRSETDRFIKRRDLDEHLPIPKLRYICDNKPSHEKSDVSVVP